MGAILVADLVIQDFSVDPLTFSPGDVVDVRWRFLNVGDQIANGPTSTALLSLDDEITIPQRVGTAGDLPIGSTGINPFFGAGEVAEGAVAWDVPETLSLGPAFIAVVADPSGAVMESDETNNRSQFIPVTIVGENPGVTLFGDAGPDPLGGGDAEDVLFGEGGDDVLSGGAGRDRLDGAAGDDRLDGGAGIDRMTGGAGDDVFLVDDPDDVVVEAAGGGYDRVETTANYVIPANVEVLSGEGSPFGLVLNGSAGRDFVVGANRIRSGDTIRGEDGRDRLVGRVGDDEIFGGDGGDRIFGNSGDDTIDGGGGDDRLTGQFGADRFVYSAGDDRITDFRSGEDVLDLSFHGFADRQAVLDATVDTADGALIAITDDGSILLEGVAKSTLQLDDFDV